MPADPAIEAAAKAAYVELSVEEVVLPMMGREFASPSEITHRVALAAQPAERTAAEMRREIEAR